MLFQFFESFRMAFVSLKTNKLRSFLTLVGIAIGLFSIIIVMTAIGAIQSSVEQTFNSIGKNNFYIQKMPAVRMGGPGSWRKYRKRKDLTIEQGEDLKKMTSIPSAIGISFSKGGRVAKFSENSTNPDVRIQGINYDELLVGETDIADGRNFSKQDFEYGRNVCVIGQDLVTKLFPRVYPIGQKIKVDKLNLDVIGVAEKQGSTFGQSQDNYILIPLKVYVGEYGDRRSAGLSVRVEDFEQLEAAQDEVIGALRTIRKVPVGEDNDFEIVTYDQLIGQFNDLTKYFKIGAGVVAFIALIAAGIGIMNIMLVSVTERTREIGIRKAIGAKNTVIRTQFVLEAIVLSQVGGIIGILLGVLGGNIVALLLSVSVILPIEWILIGFAVTTFVGVVFGVYPAIKASNLDPIESLRYE